MDLKRAERRFKLTTREYAQLAAFRHALRSFLRFSETAASELGLSAQHYQAMLIVRSWPEDRRVSIADLAEQLLIKHNSAVGLVDRLELEGLIVREPSSSDRRKVELRLSAHGRRVLARLAAMHRRELQRIGPRLRRFFDELGQLQDAPPSPPQKAGRKDGVAEGTAGSGPRRRAAR